MKASQGKIGRAFVLQLEIRDVIPDCIEEFAKKNGIAVGHVILIGGIGSGEVVVGPRDSKEMPPDPMLLPVVGAHELLGIGIIAPDKNGKQILHIHGSLGRAGQSLTGCLRLGVKTWLIGEAIIYEITGAKAARLLDKKSGFELLEVEP